jgi:hypothetical protein
MEIKMKVNEHGGPVFPLMFEFFYQGKLAGIIKSKDETDNPFVPDVKESWDVYYADEGRWGNSPSLTSAIHYAEKHVIKSR